MQIRSFLLALVFLVITLPELAAPLAVYDDALQNEWVVYPWGTCNLAVASPVHAGTYSISLIPRNWEALYLHNNGSVSGADYDGLEFWIHGGTTGGQQLRVVFLSGGSILADVNLATYLPGGPVAGSWSSVRIPLDAIGIGMGSFNELYFQDGSGTTQATIYLDDMRLTERPIGPATPISVAVDPSADRRAVNPHIFGVSLTALAQAGQPAYPLRRWGGNATTRYSWQDDASNRGSDWFFFSYPNDTVVSQLPDNSTCDRFIDDSRAHGAEPLLTVPLIGWTPLDRQQRWGFSVAKYGAQDATECTATNYEPWCNPDAGNGMHAGGATPVTGNDPADTSRVITPSFVTGWMAHIASRVGTAGAGGLKFFALDNEPALWNSTHRDVHPVAVSDAELWQRTQDYASAMKAQDPATITFGPVTWGWCDLFYSASDGCGPGPDHAAHGDSLSWYLDQVEAYRQAHGVRLVDYLDVHYYPQGTNVALTDDESAGVAALRLRSLKALYDPSYTDESWIGQPVFLIPMLKALIAAHAPGTKLAITEYQWGNDGGLSSALAQVELLGIFAREGVDAAARWVAPALGSLVEDSFKLYLNYDGAGSSASGESVRALSSAVDEVGAYALRRADGRLFVVLINKATSARDVTVTVAGGLSGNLSVYGFDGAARLGPLGTVSPAGGAFALAMPARSARLAVGQIPCAPPAVAELRGAKISSGSELKLTWADAVGAVDYAVYEDTSPAGTFATLRGTSVGGAAGLTFAMPSGIRYYLVLARNACGNGPLN